MIGFGESDNLAGATFAGFDLPVAQSLFGLEGQFSNITVIADEGVSPDLLRNSIAQALPEGVEAVTAAKIRGAGLGTQGKPSPPTTGPRRGRSTGLCCRAMPGSSSSCSPACG